MGLADGFTGFGSGPRRLPFETLAVTTMTQISQEHPGLAPMLGLPAGIVGLGHYVPPNSVSNQDLESLLNTTDEWITSRTGIRARRRVTPDLATSDLAVEAGRRALSDAGLDPLQIDLVIVASMTPDQPMPCTACIVQERLGCKKAGAFDINVSCSGFAYALATGAQFVASGTARYVLVVGADVMSKIVDWTDRATCVLFGDGAGAVVLGPVKPGYGVLSCHLGADGSGQDALKVPAGGSRVPRLTPNVPDHDFFLQMDGKEVFRFAVQVMGGAALKVLEKVGLGSKDVALFIPHQANIRIIEAATKRLGLPKEKVFVNLEHYGNTSCGSIPLAMSEARDQGRFQIGDLVVLVGFGGGLSWGAVALRWCGTGVQTTAV